MDKTGVKSSGVLTGVLLQSVPYNAYLVGKSDIYTNTAVYRLNNKINQSIYQFIGVIV